MVEINDRELVFSFPEVDDEALLRVHFGGLDSPNAHIEIRGSCQEGLRLTTVGRFVVYLRPNVLRRDRLYRSGVRYPFALLVSVRGKNAVTGGIAAELARSPQNYFATPPQGGIDGHFFESTVHWFRTAADDHANRSRLEIKAFPMKKAALAHYKEQLQLIPGWGPKISGLTLKHGGERECEPIYEDLCCLGDWDQSRYEQASVWVSSGA